MLAVDELRNIVHRARAIESIHGNQVLKASGMQFNEILLHACRLKLEGARCHSLAIQLVGLGVIDGNLLDVDIDAMIELDVGNGFLDNREVFQSQEVHLNQACILNHTALVLGDDDALTIAVCSSAHRNPIGNVVTADNHAAGMNTCTAHTALQLLGKPDGLAHPGILIIQFIAELREAFQAVFNSDFVLFPGFFFGHLVRSRRDELGQTVALGHRQVLDTRHVLDGALGSHGAIGHDMGHFLGTVFLGHVIEHSGAAVIIKVGVDIWQRDAVRIKETLKQQVILHRVNFGDTQAISHRRTRSRTAAWSHRAS